MGLPHEEPVLMLGLLVPDSDMAMPAPSCSISAVYFASHAKLQRLLGTGWHGLIHFLSRA